MSDYDGVGAGDLMTLEECAQAMDEMTDRIATLESTLRKARWHVTGIFGESHPVVIAIDKALSEGKETTEEPDQ